MFRSMFTLVLTGLILFAGAGLTQAASRAQPLAANQVEIGKVQGQLRALGFLREPVTWRLDAATRSALRDFQALWHLSATGSLNQATERALQRDLDRRLHLVHGALGTAPLTIGDVGRPVAELQGDLRRLGYDPGPVDGAFMYATGRALMRFQAAHGLAVTEVLDPATYALLEQWMRNPTLPTRTASSAGAPPTGRAPSAPPPVRVLHMIATAYGPSYQDNYPYGPVDYFGAPLEPGMVAVDPAVIPLGSRVYVTGYHFPGLPPGGFQGVAADTGGAIVGNRLDIYLDAPSATVRQFGIQAVTVYVQGK